VAVSFKTGARPVGDDALMAIQMKLGWVIVYVDEPPAAALDAGCESLAAPEDKPQGQRVAYVRDPFGTLVELATPL
jgi:lactoylglutathione lyase